MYWAIVAKLDETRLIRQDFKEIAVHTTEGIVNQKLIDTSYYYVITCGGHQNLALFVHRLIRRRKVRCEYTVKVDKKLSAVNSHYSLFIIFVQTLKIAIFRLLIILGPEEKTTVAGF